MTYIQRILVTAGKIDLLNRIEKIIAKPAFIKEWLRQDNLDDDIEYRAKDNGMDDDEVENLSEKDKKKIARSILQDLWEDFSFDFSQKSEEQNGMLVGLRCLQVPNAEKFIKKIASGKYEKGFQGIGMYYSWDHSAADCHGSSGNGDKLYIKTLIPYESIQVDWMAAANMQLSTGKDEAEISVKETAPVYVIEVLDRTRKSLWKAPDKPLKLAAAKQEGVEHPEGGTFWGNAGAGCLFYAEDTKKICIQKRGPKTKEPGTWGTFGGAVDKGETPQEGLLREIEEETTYKGEKRILPINVYKNGNFSYHNFLVRVPKEFTPKPMPEHAWETSDFKWVTLDNLPKPLHFGIKNLLPDLEKYLKENP